jgi:group I intron endonuclease
MIGIYKITSPSGKIYIGQSVDIKTRFRKYKYLNCKRQTYLYNSFQKYKVENHIFEIIEECTLEQLNEREIYWGTYYNVLNKNGLNLRLGDANGKCSEETKQKIGKGNKNKIMSEEARNNISKALKGRKNTWSTSEKHGEKISKGLKEYYQNPENKEKISKGLKEYYKNNKHKPKPKLVSESTVKEIRTKYSTGNYSKSDLSREYNLSWGTIKNIVDSINSYKNVGNK